MAQAASVPESPPPPPAPASGVFRRLLRLLRPYRGSIVLGLVLLLASMPAELFPAFVWMYVADHLVTSNPTPATQRLHQFFSFGGRLQGWQQLLASALAWLFVIYLMGEL